MADEKKDNSDEEMSDIGQEKVLVNPTAALEPIQVKLAQLALGSPNVNANINMQVLIPPEQQLGEFLGLGPPPVAMAVDDVADNGQINAMVQEEPFPLAQGPPLVVNDNIPIAELIAMPNQVKIRKYKSFSFHIFVNEKEGDELILSKLRC
jgi:hypothetical protein